MIREATESDLAEITEIYRPAVLHGLASFEYEPPNLNEMQRRFRALAEIEMPYIVCEIDGEIAGYAYAGRYRTRPGYRWTVEDSIYVRDSAQGKGVGKSLLQELLKQCEAKGFRQMIAIIGNSGNQSSVKLHESCGFDMIGIERNVGWKNGKWVDCVMMQKALGDGGTSVPDETAYPANLP